MSIRIIEACGADGTVLRIDGRLEAQDVAEVHRSFRTARPPIVLELTNLQSAEWPGIDALRDLQAQGAQIRGATAFIQLLMQDGPVAD